MKQFTKTELIYWLAKANHDSVVAGILKDGESDYLHEIFLHGENNLIDKTEEELLEDFKNFSEEPCEIVTKYEIKAHPQAANLRIAVSKDDNITHTAHPDLDLGTVWAAVNLQFVELGGGQYMVQPKEWHDLVNSK